MHCLAKFVDGRHGPTVLRPEIMSNISDVKEPIPILVVLTKASVLESEFGRLRTRRAHYFCFGYCEYFDCALACPTTSLTIGQDHERRP